MSFVPTVPGESCDRSKPGRREEILGVATALFAEYGYNDTDTQVLADRLGVGKGTIYRCFASKRELFLAAADRAMDLLWACLEASGEGIRDPLERIEVAVRAYLDFFAEHPEFVELLVQERALFKDRKKPTYFEHRDRHADRWRGLYRELIAEGRIREMPVDRIRDVMSYLLYGTMFTNFFNGREKSSECQSREILDVVFRGILSASAQERLRDHPPFLIDPQLNPPPPAELS